MRLRPALPLAAVLATLAVSGHADDKFRYEHAQLTGVATAGGQTQITINRGLEDGVYVGSTGMVYDGAKTKSNEENVPFLQDPQGAAFSFRVSVAGPRESTAVITKGSGDALLRANTHLVLRAVPYREGCGEVAKVDGYGVDKCVVERIRRWDAVIDKAAKDHSVDANLLRGIIASETEGKTNEVSGSGYKGITQSNRAFLNLEAELSIAAGAENVQAKEKSLRAKLKGVGSDYDALSPDERAEALLAAYNAGQVTVVKAFGYAQKGGGKWSDFANYGRALLFTGAYSAKAAAGSCGVKDKPDVVKQAETARLQYECLTEADKDDDNDKGGCKKTDVTFDEARALGAPELMLCAVKFKADRGVPYRARIKAYRKYFAGGK